MPKLYAEARKAAGKFGVDDLPLPGLPYMTRQAVYAMLAATLISLPPRAGAGTDQL